MPQKQHKPEEIVAKLRQDHVACCRVSTASFKGHPVAGFAIRNRAAGHPGRSVKTRRALRLKPDHSIGAGHSLV